MPTELRLVHTVKGSACQGWWQAIKVVAAGVHSVIRRSHQCRTAAVCRMHCNSCAALSAAQWVTPNRCKGQAVAVTLREGRSLMELSVTREQASSLGSIVFQQQPAPCPGTSIMARFEHVQATSSHYHQNGTGSSHHDKRGFASICHNF
jgi:hypothetical protein